MKKLAIVLIPLTMLSLILGTIACCSGGGGQQPTTTPSTTSTPTGTTTPKPTPTPSTSGETLLHKSPEETMTEFFNLLEGGKTEDAQQLTYDYNVYYKEMEIEYPYVGWAITEIKIIEGWPTEVVTGKLGYEVSYDIYFAQGSYVHGLMSFVKETDTWLVYHFHNSIFITID